MKLINHPAVVVLAALLALPLLGQSAGQAAPGAGACSAVADRPLEHRLHTTRVIDDWSTHRRWILNRDSDRPAAPAKLVLLRDESSCTFLDTRERAARYPGEVHRQLIPVIRSGDAVILLEHTSVSDGRLEATALSGAAVGEAVTVRLKVGGPPLRAIAIAPRQATLLGEL